MRPVHDGALRDFGQYLLKEGCAARAVADASDQPTLRMYADLTTIVAA